jgi:uncharacterized protein (DUF1800 family)
MGLLPTQELSYSHLPYDESAHLLRRATFGSTSAEIQESVRLGLTGTTDRLLHEEDIDDPIDDDAIMEKASAMSYDQFQHVFEDQVQANTVRIWWAYRMIASPRQLTEKMVLFWHNHFTSNDNDGDLMYGQNQIFRKHALGNFRTLTLAVSKNAEMLRYLSGDQNYKAHPNENYARELMELFTCGRVGPDGKSNYTEDDIKASARAFSGWNMQGIDFGFNPQQHDDTVKTFMGRTANLNGSDIVDLLVSLPQTASYLCSKLYRYFISGEPNQRVLNELIGTYYSSGYDIKAIVSRILRSDTFYSDAARYAVIKWPAQLVIGTVRMTGLGNVYAPPVHMVVMNSSGEPDPLLREFDTDASMNAQSLTASTVFGRLSSLGNAMRAMGQDLLAPPTVKGWDAGKMWINTQTMQARARFALDFSQRKELDPSALVGFDLTPPVSVPRPRAAAYSPVLGTPKPTSPSSLPASVSSAKIVDRILQIMGPLPVSTAVRQSLVSYADTIPNPDERVRSVLMLAMGTPEYQVC